MPDDSPRGRARLALLGLSLGDALGHSLMWCADRIPRRGEPPTPWAWSDDTEMALSIVASLEAEGAIAQDALARRFVENFHVGRMYGPAMYHEFFPRVKAGEHWRVVAGSLFGGRGSYGNGGAMRVAPLGAWFARDLEAVAAQARLSAEVTHQHEEAIAGAIAVALATGWACRLRGAPPPTAPSVLIELVLPQVPESEVRRRLVEATRLGERERLADVVQVLGNGARVTAQDTVPFALWSAARHLGDFREALWSTISALGDMDTNAAMVGGIVASYLGEAGIPARWVRCREPLPEVR